MTGTAAKSEQGSRNLLSLLWVLFAALSAGALWLLFGRKAGDQHVINEKSAFASLQKACKSDSAGQVHSTIHTWLSYCSFATAANSRIVTLNDFARACNDKKLATELEHLQSALVSSDSHWRGTDLLSSLQTLRQKFNKQKKVQSTVGLSPLNP